MKLLRVGERENFFYLFSALSLLILVVPVLATAFGNLGALFGTVCFSLALVLALWSMRGSRLWFFIGVGLVLVQILASAGWLLQDSIGAHRLAIFSGLVFFVVSCTIAARHVFRQNRVDLNKVLGALCIYLLLGVIWAELFSLLESFQPGSFSGLPSLEAGDRAWRFLYFSFVTLTTLGYGDVLPLNTYAETLVFTEAIVGQFYLAVLVAGLIGAYLSDRER